MTLTIEELKYGAEVGDLGIDAVRAVCAEALANREAQPVLCVDRDSDFIKHIQKCSEEVAKWPEWKRRWDDVTEFTAPPAPGVVKLPATRLWAGVIECYEKSDVIAALRAANVGVSDD